MNPLAQNPVEFADALGIRISAKIIAAGYRKFGINPIMMRHVPRAALTVDTAAMAVAGPADGLPMLVLALSFALSSVFKIQEDLPSIHADWNADVFRSYSAKALMARENTVLRRILLCVTVALSTIGTGIVYSTTVPLAVPFACFLVMGFSFIFDEWFAAAELPEPDDGDREFASQPS